MGGFDPKEAERLYSATCALEPIEAGRFLDRACIDAPDLRAAVERLLADRREPPTTLAAPPAHAETPTLVERASDQLLSAAKKSGATPAWTHVELPDSARLGRYLVLRHVAAGGMGDIYSAYDESLDRKVALKLLRQSAISDWSLRREAQALARLSHPNVVQVYDIGNYEGQPFVAMEFVTGVPLSKWLSAAERGPNEILRMFLQCGRGLVAAHEAGLVHRDFKPANVVVGDDGRARVLDFGIVSGPSIDPTAKPDVDSLRAGTPQYMSPEQLTGEAATPASDQFSFSVALYRALYGQKPFRGEELPALQANVLLGEIQPPPPGKGPDWIVPILKRGLARDADKRYPSLSAMLVEIEAHFPRDPELDPNASRSARLVVGGAIIVGAAGILIVARLAGLMTTITPLKLLAVPSAVFGITGAGAVLFRKRLLENRYGAQVLGVMLVISATMLGHRLIALKLDQPIPQVLAVDMLVIAAELALASLLLVRWFARCAVLMFLGSVGALFFPSWAVFAMILSSFSALGVALLGMQKD